MSAANRTQAATGASRGVKCTSASHCGPSVVEVRQRPLPESPSPRLDRAGLPDHRLAHLTSTHSGAFSHRSRLGNRAIGASCAHESTPSSSVSPHQLVRLRRDRRQVLPPVTVELDVQRLPQDGDDGSVHPPTAGRPPEPNGRAEGEPAYCLASHRAATPFASTRRSSGVGLATLAVSAVARAAPVTFVTQDRECSHAICDIFAMKRANMTNKR